MSAHLHAVVFRSILAHGPVTKAAIAIALGMEFVTAGRALEQLLGVGSIGVTGHEPDGEPLYAALTC